MRLLIPSTLIWIQSSIPWINAFQINPHMHSTHITRSSSHLYAKRRKNEKAEDIFSNQWYDEVEKDSTPDDIFWNEMERQKSVAGIVPDTNVDPLSALNSGMNIGPNDGPKRAGGGNMGKSSGGTFTNSIVGGGGMSSMNTNTMGGGSTMPARTFSEEKSTDAVLASFSAHAVDDNWLDEEYIAQMKMLNEEEGNDAMNLEEQDLLLDKKTEGGVYVVSGLNWGSSSFVNTTCVGNRHTSQQQQDTNLTVLQNHEDLLLSLGKRSNKGSEFNAQTLNIFTGDSGRLYQKYAIKNLETWTSENHHEPTNKSIDSSPPIGTILNRCIAGGCGNKILQTTASGIGMNDGNAISIIQPGTCSWDTAAPTAILFAALAKYGKQGKVTDLFGGELVYSPTGKKVTNDLGALISIGPMAGYYHDKISQTFRGDEIVLDSLLKNYWRVHPKELKDCGRGKKANTSIDSLIIAQTEPQAIHFVRGEKGYVMTCAEVKSLVSEQIMPCGDSELIGYSIPEKNSVQNSQRKGKVIDTCILHLFWIDNQNDPNTGVPRLPTTLVYEKVQMDEFNHCVTLTRM